MTPRQAVAIAMALALLSPLVACDDRPQRPRVLAGPEVVAQTAPEATPAPAQASAKLASLVRARPSQESVFMRSAFGSGWGDPDRNGCPADRDVHARWLGAIQVAGNCVVAGSLRDPYAGSSVTVPDDVDVDHIVSLPEAWRSGASTWPGSRRVTFYSDGRNLAPTAKRVAQDKRERPADQWMPPSADYRCTYASAYVSVKFEYALTVTEAEAARLAEALALCVESAPPRG